MQVKEVRKKYIKEVELMRLEKLRKDEARKEALRLQNEERRKLKAEVAKARAQERQVAEEEFRQTLVCDSLSLSLSHSLTFVVLFGCLVSGKMWENDGKFVKFLSSFRCLCS